MKDTKENILQVALGLFARDGYEAVSVSEIAGALGITKGALYRHYAGKRDIFDSILAAWKKKMRSVPRSIGCRKARWQKCSRHIERRRSGS